ncbi:MAG: hypothetical protein IKK32_04740 [Oscillospiraceae bacterium]|nr:hypothetical protein [Oscillospiraceae bacterium]
MSFYVLANDIISVLSKTKIPAYHQFGEELIARRNDTFITVGITGIKTDEADSEAEAEISFYTPSNFSGGKILSLASKIPETIMTSDLSVKSIKASDLFYEKKLDRLCYNFSLKLNYSIGDIKDTISIGGTEISVSSFSFSRKHAVSEIKTLSAGVMAKGSGEHPLSLSVKGKTKLSAKSFAELDNAVKNFTPITINIGGAYLPSMCLSSYKLRGGRMAFIEAEFIEIKGDENE